MIGSSSLKDHHDRYDCLDVQASFFRMVLLSLPITNSSMGSAGLGGFLVLNSLSLSSSFSLLNIHQKRSQQVMECIHAMTPMAKLMMTSVVSV